MSEYARLGDNGRESRSRRSLADRDHVTVGETRAIGRAGAGGTPPLLSRNLAREPPKWTALVSVAPFIMAPITYDDLVDLDDFTREAAAHLPEKVSLDSE